MSSENILIYNGELENVNADSPYPFSLTSVSLTAFQVSHCIVSTAFFENSRTCIPLDTGMQSSFRELLKLAELETEKVPKNSKGSKSIRKQLREAHQDSHLLN